MFTNKTHAVASCEDDDDDILEVWTPNKSEAALSPASHFNSRKRTKRVSGKTTGVWPPAGKIELLDRLDGLAPGPRKKMRNAKLGHRSFANNAVTLKKETSLDDSRRTNSGQKSSISNAVAIKNDEILDDSTHANMGRKASSSSSAVAAEKQEGIDSYSAKKSSLPDSPIASLEPAKVKKADEDVRLGLRVYAEWEDGLYHPAEVIAIKKDNQYSLLFYDGCVIECAPRESFITERDYPMYYGNKLDEPPEEHKQRIQAMKKAWALKIKKLRSLSSPLSLEELLDHKCERCSQCTRDDCGRCASCLTNRYEYDRLCIQKMCCHVSVTAKAQPMPPFTKFPPGWAFVIDPTMKGQFMEKEPMKLAKGLRIVPPNGRYLYYSVEGAKKHRTEALKHVEPIKFYQYIGVMDNPEHEAQVVSVYDSRPSKKNTARPTMAVIQDAHETDVVAQSRELSTARVVGSRVFCKKIKEERFWGTIAAMFHIKHDKCRYWVRREDNNSILEDIEDSHVISETRFKNLTQTFPPPPLVSQSGGGAPYERPRKLKGTGTRMTKNHILVGRRFCLAWTDLSDQTKVAQGEVNECEEKIESGEMISFKVTFTSASRGQFNYSIPKSGRLAVPKSQLLKPLLVLGGCLLFEREMQAVNKPPLHNCFPKQPYYWSWVTPDIRHEELVDSNSGEDNHLPRLTLELRGFRLVLTVKPSTIPGAGYGLFLACRPVEGTPHGDPASFRLKAGELIDLGPLRIQDKKLHAVIQVKNFVHSYKIEEWALNHGDERYQIDLTDDITGDLHAAAVSHVHTYVNEAANDDAATVHMELDPDGNLHYLVGHSESAKSTFCVPADGSQIEVFVNYGVQYEKVRVRKGYSVLSDFEKNNLLEIIALADASNVKAMDELHKADVKACVKFLSELFSTNEKCLFAPKVIQRALTCAVVLQRRLLGGKKGGNDEDVKDVGYLVSLLVDMSGDEQLGLKELQTSGNFKQLLRRVFELHKFSKEELCELSYMME